MCEKLYTIELVARRRWWVTPYIHILAALCALFGTEPDCEKFGKLLAKFGYKYSAKLKEVK